MQGRLKIKTDLLGYYYRDNLPQGCFLGIVFVVNRVYVHDLENHSKTMTLRFKKNTELQFLRLIFSSTNRS